jgi:hypothetical protein
LPGVASLEQESNGSSIRMPRLVLLLALYYITYTTTSFSYDHAMKSTIARQLGDIDPPLKEKIFNLRTEDTGVVVRCDAWVKPSFDKMGESHDGGKSCRLVHLFYEVWYTRVTSLQATVCIKWSRDCLEGRKETGGKSWYTEYLRSYVLLLLSSPTAWLEYSSNTSSNNSAWAYEYK